MLIDANRVLSVGACARYSPTEREQVMLQLEGYRTNSALFDLFCPEVGTARLVENGLGGAFEIMCPPSSEPALQGMRLVYRGDREGIEKVFLQSLSGQTEVTLRHRIWQYPDERRVTERDRTTFDDLLSALEQKYLRR